MNEKKITNAITVGGQPGADDIREIAAAGYRTVVNLRTDGEEGILPDEKEAVEHASLNYAAIPGAPDILDDIAVQRFSQAVSSLDSQPAYVHCKGGGRAGVMTLLHLAIEHGWSLEETLRQGEKLGGIGPSETSPYRPFFEDYIRRHSPAER